MPACGLERIDQRRRLIDVFRRLRQLRPARGDDELVHGEAVGGGHNDGDAGLVQESGTNRLADQKIEEGESLSADVEGGQRCRLVAMLRAAAARGQEFDLEAASVAKSGGDARIAPFFDRTKLGSTARNASETGAAWSSSASDTPKSWATSTSSVA